MVSLSFGVGETNCSQGTCIRDGVGQWNIVEDLITLELKGLSSIAKMTTVSPKCSTFLSDHQVRTWGICHMLDNDWRPRTTCWIEDSGNSERSGCWAILSYCTFCLSCLSWSLNKHWCRHLHRMSALIQVVSLSDILSYSEAMQVKVNQDRVGCYGVKAWLIEDPGQINK